MKLATFSAGPASELGVVIDPNYVDHIAESGLGAIENRCAAEAAK